MKINDPIRSESTEKKVLSCLIYQPNVWFEVSDTLTRGHFWSHQHKIIFSTIRTIHDNKADVSTASVLAHLEKEGLTAEAGGEDKVRDIATDIHFPEEARPLVDLLDDYYRKRQYQMTGFEVAAGLAGGSLKADDAFEAFAAQVDAQSSNKTFKLGVQLDEGLKEWCEMQKRIMEGEEGLHVPTGIQPLDKVLHGGIVTSRFYMLAARPKMGKTKLAVAMADALMQRHGYHVEFWYTDGSRRDILTEFLAASGKLPTNYLNEPMKVPADAKESFFKRQTQTVANLKSYGSMNIYAVGTPSIEDITRTTRAVAARQDKKVILIVDYLQNVTAGFHGDDYQNATVVSRELAGLRTDLDIVVFALAQFNRQAASGGGMPKPHQLRASGQIEQDVNHLMIWHRDALDKEEATPMELRRGTLWHALSKHSAPGKVTVDADLRINHFTTFKHPF